LKTSPTKKSSALSESGPHCAERIILVRHPSGGGLGEPLNTGEGLPERAVVRMPRWFLLNCPKVQFSSPGFSIVECDREFCGGDCGVGARARFSDNFPNYLFLFEDSSFMARAIRVNSIRSKISLLWKCSPPSTF